MPGAEDRGSTPGRDWPKSLQHLVTDSLPNARQQVCPRRWPLLKVGLCRSRYGTSKIPHCHECRAKFAVLHHQWWRLQVRKILEWSEKNPQTNKPYHSKISHAIEISYHALECLCHSTVKSFVNWVLSIWTWNQFLLCEEVTIKRWFICKSEMTLQKHTYLHVSSEGYQVFLLSTCKEILNKEVIFFSFEDKIILRFKFAAYEIGASIVFKVLKC